MNEILPHRLTDSKPLAFPPPSIAGDTPPSLGERNLIRGLMMGLPSGRAVAKHRGFPVVPDEQLTVCKAGIDPIIDKPLHLGPVGGRIVGEVFVGLMMADSHSYPRQDPTWKPIPELTDNGTFGIAQLPA